MSDAVGAAEVLAAICHKYPRCAVIPEVVINAGTHAEWADYRADPELGQPVRTRRIDALMFDGPQRTAIEVKTSVVDLRRDSWDKQAPWLNVTHRFVYAMPAAMASHHDIPVPQAGIWWVYDDGRIEVHRKAQIRKYPEPLPQHVWVAIAYRAAGVQRIGTV